MKRKDSIVATLLFAAVFAFAACGGGGTESSGPREGTPEWYWDAAAYNLAKGDYKKAIDQLDDVVDSESELAPRAALWRATLLAGLTKGYEEIIDAFKIAIKEKDSLAGTLQNPLNQHQRDARQFAIAFAESLGDLEKAVSGEKVTLDFSFPTGSAAESIVLRKIAEGDPEAVLRTAEASEAALRRGILLAVAQLSGAGEDAAKAKALFDAGPVDVDPLDAKVVVAHYLLDMSTLFERTRLNEPTVRNILLDRAEQWFASAQEAERDDEEFTEMVKDFEFDLENERRNMKGKARWEKRRGK